MRILDADGTISPEAIVGGVIIAPLAACALGVWWLGALAVLALMGLHLYVAFAK